MGQITFVSGNMFSDNVSPHLEANHLCIVIARSTKETIKEYKVKARDWYYARHMAANLFRSEHPEETRDWCVDSCEI
jgi:hypothetical protein